MVDNTTFVYYALLTFSKFIAVLFLSKTAHNSNCIYIYIYIYIYIVSCPTIVKGNLEAHFSIATTLRWRRGCYSIPWIALLTLKLYLIMLSVKQGGTKYHFLNFRYDSTWD